MHVLLVSACEKRAIKKTRALLDSYAIRVGEKTWATPMTQEGLHELRAALKRTATRQTAVACYRNDGYRRMKLLWTVGSRSTFGPDGHFPGGTYTRQIRTASFTTPWVCTASLLAQAAGLVHDIGKNTPRFQGKLRGNFPPKDEIRHEWMSVKLLQALRRNGRDWSRSWEALKTRISEVTFADRTVGPDSDESVSSVTEAIDFLIMSHHGLLRSEENLHSSEPTLPTAARHVRTPSPSAAQITAAGELDATILEDYWKLEAKLLEKHDSSNTLFWHAVLAYARPALIFADQTVSGRHEPLLPRKKNALYANTDRYKSGRPLKQLLNDHLRQVGKLAAQTVWHMAQLTALSQQRLFSPDLSGLSEESVDQILAPADPNGRFVWQNRCAAALEEIHRQFPDCPVLVLNMAGTGSGKTRMNVRAACCVSRDPRPRLAIALNLRTLTLQTGRALSSGLGIGPDELATVIGDKTTQHLFDSTADNSLLSNEHDDYTDPDENPPESDFDCFGSPHTVPEWMAAYLETETERLLLGAPLLVSTIDFLIEAGTPGKQGHHVKAVMRLMSSDLILDEIDGYEPDALVAVLRLVQLSALFRRNVICSSATLSPPVATAIERAYRSGLAMLDCLESHQAASPEKEEKDASPIGFIRALIDDDLSPDVEYIRHEDDDFAKRYETRLNAIAESVARKPPYRIARLQPVTSQTRAGWFTAVAEAVTGLHRHHRWPLNDSGKSVSFGLVRVANVGTAIDLARYLASELPHARIACYHSQEFLIARFHKERRLDQLLSRQNGNQGILKDTEINRLVSQSDTDSVPFIVVATPVEEIGRDHDFDWSVIEPSSSQSIVQTAGRVNRHRLVVANVPNVALLQYNLRHCKNVESRHSNEAAFIFPGYERPGRGRGFQTHDLAKLLAWKTSDDTWTLTLDARLRFDTGQCVLACEDDHTISCRLKPYYGKTGCFVASPVHSWILTDDPYHKTPLRDRSLLKETWLVKWEDGYTDYFRKEADDNPIPRSPNYVWKNQKMREVPARPNAWLALPPEDMVTLCEEMTISPEQGMQAELLAYHPDARFEYDLGFGIQRTRK